MRVRTAAVAVTVLALSAGCRETEWPSDADQADFCDAVTGTPVAQGELDVDLRHLGTPANLPFEARRYLLDLDEGEQTDPVGEQAFEGYVADYC